MAIKKLSGRDINEPHRVSTPLELLFDLTFVVAIAISSAEMHHNISSGHGMDSLLMFLPTFYFLITLEMLVPVIAERADRVQNGTPWHAGCIFCFHQAKPFIIIVSVAFYGATDISSLLPL